MLIHGGFTHYNSLSHSPISKSLLFPTKPHLNYVLNKVPHHKFPSFHGTIRTGFCRFASKNPLKKVNETIFQIEEIEDDDVDEFEDDDVDESEDDDEYDDDDKEVDDGIDKEKMLAGMAAGYKEFLKSYKPKEFGEGKVYDTSLEDKLIADFELSKAANLNKIKTSPQKQTAKEASPTPSGVSVRLRNLPRKKNIERDLKAAFKEFPGILKIVPAVNGNKKTKEPSCKGHAFVYFKSLNEANRFVELFSGQILTFGKIQQKINCMVVNPSSPNSTDKQADDKLVLPLLPLDPSSEDLNPQLSTNSEEPIDEKVSKTRLYTGIIDNFTPLESIDIDSQELEDSATDADPLENQKENEAKGKIFIL